MTRVIVYAAGFVAFLAATTMTITAVVLPNWITFHSYIPPSGDSPGDDLTYSYGLHRVCSSQWEQSCKPFPNPHDCSGQGAHFCAVWRTTGFLMNFAAVLELATVIVYVIMILGEKQKRRRGWKLLAGMLVWTAMIQCAAMAFVAYCYDNDDRFFPPSHPNWSLDTSWILCTVSWCVMILSAGFIVLSAYVFPTEAGFELIPSERVLSRNEPGSSENIPSEQTPLLK